MTDKLAFHQNMRHTCQKNSLSLRKKKTHGKFSTLQINLHGHNNTYEHYPYQKSIKPVKWYGLPNYTEINGSYPSSLLIRKL